jgi:D5 N terminal like
MDSNLSGSGKAENGNVVEFPRAVGIAKSELHVVIGNAVLEHMRAQDEALINGPKGAWLYSRGIWELRTDIDAWLGMRIETVSEGLGFTNTNKLTSEVRNRILRRPEIWHDDVPWDQHGKIPTRSGLVDPKTGELEPARPDHFCTWRVEVEYDPAAKCPWWETMIADMFGDRDPAEQSALVRVVQECMGAALIDQKPRALSKAVVFWGIQNLGKSGPLDVVAGLFGGTIAAPIGSVEGTHGLMPFVKRFPWVLHEAFGGAWHFSSVVKSIITQEPVMINVKNGPMITTAIRAPIFWATNFQPQFKESTRAIVSRMIVIEVSRQFYDDKPIGAAAEALRRGFAKPGELIVATELPGVLNWAIAGLRRALKRGSIEVTAGIKETAEAIHRDSNLVAGFLDECVEFDPAARIRITDFCLAHSAWWMELKGEDRRLPTNEAISKALTAIGDGRVGMHRKEMRDNAARYYCGVALNRAGLRYHRAAFESRLFEGKTATATNPDSEVNGLIPASWENKKSIIKMREQHAIRVTRDQNADERAVPGH